MAKRPSGDPVVKQLFGMSDNRCAFQDPDKGNARCQEILSSEEWRRVNAVICHIKGLNPGSARYDATMSDMERNAFENLILMCPNHSRRIDDLEPERFSPEALVAMKQESEKNGGHLVDKISDEELTRRTLALMVRSRASRALAEDISAVDVARRASSLVRDAAGRPMEPVLTIAIDASGEIDPNEILSRTCPSVDMGNYGANIENDPTGKPWVVWACDHPDTFMSIVGEVEGLVCEGVVDVEGVAFFSPPNIPRSGAN